MANLGSHEIIAFIAAKNAGRSREFYEAQDDLGIRTFPGGSKVIWFKDPDGNVRSVTEFASHA